MTGRRLVGRRTRRLWTASALVVLGLLLPAVLLPRVVAPFTATTSNGPSTVSAYAWKSYVTTLQSDGVPSNWWRLGEAAGNNTAAAAAGGITGTYRNNHSSTTGPIVNDPNTAATFNPGLQQAVQFGDLGDFAGRTAFSVELWFWRTTSSNGVTSRLISKNIGNGWELAINAPDAASNKNEIYFGRFDGSSSSYTGTGAPVSLQTWHQVVATYDGTTMAVYFDGALAGTATSTLSLPGNTGQLTVACMDNLTQCYDGAIDEVSLYTSALTARQVRSHYYAALAGK